MVLDRWSVTLPQLVMSDHSFLQLPWDSSKTHVGAEISQCAPCQTTMKMSQP